MTPSFSPTLIAFGTAMAVFIGVAGLALGLRYLAFRTLNRWALRTGTPADDMLLMGLRIPSIAWCILLGLYPAIDTAHLPERLGALALNIVFGLLVLSITAAAANITGSTLGHTLNRNELAIPATGLSITILKIAIWITGLLVLLSGLGVAIAPILTALGVGGLAVALALQDTLSNLFAGLHLLMDKPIRVGDYIRLENGQEGYVVDIGWRTTRIRMPLNNLVVIPNNKLTQSILTNYSLPDPRTVVAIPIGVSYNADPDHVERVLLEEATKAAGHVAGLLAEPAPVVRLIPGFGESALNFTLTLQVRTFEDQAPVQHELRKRILKRFREEKIEIPLPAQTVHLRSPP
jgi:small-conductance mechanosensitive channel